MIDLHSHVLPGIDDGPETIEGSLALARAVAQSGVDTLLATPHVSWHYPNEADTIARLVAELNERILAEGIALRVLAGAEIAMTRAAEIEPAQLARLSLGGGPWLLVECPFTPVASGMDALVHDLQQRGHSVLLAHPERCPAFQRDRAQLEAMVRAGALVSITAGSLIGSFGGPVQRFALELVRDELVHNVASDTHDPLRRRPGIRAEIEQAGLEPLAQWLTCAVPAAILAGEEIPPRPEVELPLERRRLWPLRRR